MAACPEGGAAEVNLDNTSQIRYVQQGPWGGNDIKLDVGDPTTKIEYPCADGEITERLKLDANGNFSALGTHTVMRPGPVREDESRPQRPAAYEGRVSGDRMTLKVTLTDTKELIGTFELQKDRGTRLHRCL